MSENGLGQIDSQRASWQSRLLPLMGLLLVLGALFFGAMSVLELRDLYSRLEHRPMTFADSLAAYEAAAGEAAATPDYLRFKVLATLEADALQRRYHQANATMLARVWTRQLGFVTGMVLALVGAAFILGRLNDAPARIQGEGKGFKGALETSSPGIVLTVLGAGLMALTISIPFGVETRDANIYLGPAARAVMPPPSPMLPHEVAPAAGPVAGAPVDPLPPAVRDRERELFPK